MFLRPVGLRCYSWCVCLGIPTNQCKISGVDDPLENERTMATWFHSLCVWTRHYKQGIFDHIPPLNLSNKIQFSKENDACKTELKAKSYCVRISFLIISRQILWIIELTPRFGRYQYSTCSGISCCIFIRKWNSRLLVSQATTILSIQNILKHTNYRTTSTGNVFFADEMVGIFKSKFNY
jgi:hypothetical protein